MSRLFPHAEYAEDQPLARTILTTHVLYRGFQSGGAVGLGAGAVTYMYARSRHRSHVNSPLGTGHVSSVMKLTVPSNASQIVFRQAGVGVVYGVLISGFGLLVRMNGRDEIEWQDRSWRLLQNQGQLETDDWSLCGAGLGLISSFVQPNMAWRQVLGRTAVGSITGVMAYLCYRYGYMGGQRNEILPQSSRRQ